MWGGPPAMASSTTSTGQSVARWTLALRRRNIAATLFAMTLMAGNTPGRAADGPGVGNEAFTADELGKPLYLFDSNGGIPAGFGNDTVIHVHGYLMVLYSRDSGKPPGGLIFYDVSKPRDPVLVRHIKNADTDRFREAHSLPVAHINGRDYLDIQVIDGLQIWDVTDPVNAAMVGSLKLPGADGGDYTNAAWQGSWQGKYLFVAGTTHGLYVVDVSNPANPRLVTQVPTSRTGGFRIGPIHAMGNLLVIANMDESQSTYAVLDISDPAQPSLLSTLPGLPKVYSIMVAADRIYGAGKGGGELLIHSFTDPRRIQQIASWNPGGASGNNGPKYALPQDQYLFVGRQNDWLKIDLGVESAPTMASIAALGVSDSDNGHATPFGNLVYVGNDHGTGSGLFAHQTAPDTTPPAVVEISPLSGSTNQPVTSRISITFSDYIDMRTVNVDSVTIRPTGGAPLAGIYSYGFNVLHFGPNDALEPDTTYEIVLAAGKVTDIVGNPLAADVQSAFSTGVAVTTVDGGARDGAADGPSNRDGGGGSGGRDGAADRGGDGGSGGAGGAGGAGGTAGGGGTTGGGGGWTGTRRGAATEGCDCRLSGGQGGGTGLPKLLLLALMGMALRAGGRRPGGSRSAKR